MTNTKPVKVLIRPESDISNNATYLPSDLDVNLVPLSVSANHRGVFP